MKFCLVRNISTGSRQNILICQINMYTIYIDSIIQEIFYEPWNLANCGVKIGLEIFYVKGKDKCPNTEGHAVSSFPRLITEKTSLYKFLVGFSSRQTQIKAKIYIWS